MDLMNLAARLTLDMRDYEDALGKAGKSAQSFSKTFSGSLSRIGGAIKTVAKVGAVAIGAGAAAIGVLTKQSVSAYAEYEQLAGGVKKLFGDASDDIMRFASEAYKTSGMSANQYMEQATSFSAALINSLGGDTKKAAEQVDVAMRAMSDNVNTFGTDMASIQAAFQGFSKQNYTMLDNLKLGYGGTKTEMERLIADANEYAAANGKAANLSIESFSDIITAIELIQEKQGIAGTTAKEAATTIEGALNMTKAAWENLVAGLANPDADLDQLMDNLIVALVGDKEGTGLFNNLMPAIQRALDGIGKLISKAAPVISKNLPSLFESLLPSVISAATSLVVSLAKALPGIAKVIVDQIPMIAEMLIEALRDLGGEFASLGGDLIQRVFDGIKEKNPRIAEALSSIGESFRIIVGRMKAFWDKHGQEIFNKAVEIFNGIKSVVTEVLTVVVEGIDLFIQGALALWDEFGAEIMGYISAVKDFYVAVFQSISETITGFIEWAKAFWAEYGDEITAATQTAWEVISTVISTVLNVITGIVKAMTAMVQGDWKTAGDILQSVTQTAWNAIQKIFEIVLGIIQNVVSVALTAIENKARSIFESVKNTVSNVWTSIQAIIREKIDSIRSSISDVFTGIFTTVSTIFENIRSKATEIFEAVKYAITHPIETAKETVKNLIDDILGFFNFNWSLPELKLPHIVVGSYITVPVLGTIPDPTTLRVEWYKKAYDNPWMFTKPTVMGFGDGNGGEIVYGHDNLMGDIKDAVKEAGQRVFSPVLNIYTQEGQDNEEIAKYVMDRLKAEYERAEAVYG